MNEKLEIVRQSCLDDFNSFLITFLGDGFYCENVHWKLARFLQFNENKRKYVILPRGFLKTTTISKLYSLWRGVKDPNIRILCVSNSAVNAAKILHGIKTLVEGNDLFQQLFPEVVPNFNRVRWSDSCLELARKENFSEGTFESAGTNTNVISRHYDLIVEDDTVAPRKDDLTGDEVMPDRSMIEQAIGWHKLANPLLVDISKGEIIVCGTRWTAYDLFNHIEKNESKIYTKFSMKATSENEKNERIPNYPSRFPLAGLDAFKTSLGSYLYSALYDNNPLLGDHMVFRPEWIRAIDNNVLTHDGRIVISVEPAISQTRGSDDTAITAVRHLPGMMIVEEQVSRKMSPNDIVKETFKMGKRWGCHELIVETVAYQKMLVFAFKDIIAKTKWWFSIKETVPRRSKEERIRGLQPFMENSKFFIRKSVPIKMEQQFLDFPYGGHDDCIDGAAMHLVIFKPDWDKELDGIKAKDVEVPKEKRTKLPPFAGFLLDDVLEEMRIKHGGTRWYGA